MNKVLERLEVEDARQREKQLPKELRNRSMPRETGRFLSILTKVVRPRVVVEFGTSVGYSTIWLALGVSESDGQVITVEVDEGRIAEAESNLREAGLLNFVRVCTPGHLLGIVRAIDMVFLDHEKDLYLPTLKSIIPMINKGGVVVADNTISHSEELTSYIHFVRESGVFESTHLPLGKGLELSYKIM